MTLEQIALPDAVRLQADGILIDIGQAEGVLELARLGGIVEGFALGLSSAQALPGMVVDALESALTRAINARMAALRQA
ncbi:hypothetical protein TRP66_01045 [Pseudomonas sp. JDS28PS106]|uniref:hypothetical protein n=1 Tax=Pseudomonas sp. JDS28PS106 TaxID=2497235 RepID=UPI002FD5659C